MIIYVDKNLINEKSTGVVKFGFQVEAYFIDFTQLYYEKNESKIPNSETNKHSSKIVNPGGTRILFLYNEVGSASKLDIYHGRKSVL